MEHPGSKPPRSVTAEAIQAFADEVSRLEQAWPTLEDASAHGRYIDRLHQQLRHAEEELVTLLEQVSSTNVMLDGERRRYRDLFDRAPDAHFVTDRKGIIQEVNTAAAALLGKEATYLRGNPLSVYITRETVQEFRSAVGRVESGNLVEARLRLSVGGPNGSPAWARLRGWLTNITDRVLWVATLEMTPPGELQRAATAAARALDPSVAEAADLPLDRASHTLAAVTHELRGPLHVVLAWTNMLRQGRVPPAQRERALEVIERNVKLQSSILEGLLDVSQLALHGIELDVAPMDFAALLQFAADATTPLAEQAKVDLLCELDAPTFVSGDSVRLMQVVMNLVSNAIKFTPAGGRVTLRLRAAGGSAVFSVIDSGAGIRSEALESIFECFVQDTVGTKKKSGIGLGLYLVRKLVELHGGTVTATSDGPGRGATLVVMLPLADAPVP